MVYNIMWHRVYAYDFETLFSKNDDTHTVLCLTKYTRSSVSCGYEWLTVEIQGLFGRPRII